MVIIGVLSRIPPENSLNHKAMGTIRWSHRLIFRSDVFKSEEGQEPDGLRLFPRDFYATSSKSAFTKSTL